MNASTNDDRGLRCSACGEPRLRVIYTRPKPGARIVRRRECVALRPADYDLGKNRRPGADA
jgi:hypothetical protein